MPSGSTLIRYNSQCPSVKRSSSGSVSVTLTGTAVTYIMNGSVTTSEEDDELLEDYAELKVEVDAESFSLKVIE